MPDAGLSYDTATSGAKVSPVLGCGAGRPCGCRMRKRLKNRQFSLLLVRQPGEPPNLSVIGPLSEPAGKAGRQPRRLGEVLAVLRVGSASLSFYSARSNGAHTPLMNEITNHQRYQLTGRIELLQQNLRSICPSRAGRTQR